MSEKEPSARKWLRENGYHETADMIEEIMQEWARFGKKTRRNWWDVLAGDRQGNPRRIEGRIFPVYNAARLRQGLEPVPHAADQRKKELQEQVLSTWAVPTAVPARQAPKPEGFVAKIKRLLGLEQKMHP